MKIPDIEHFFEELDRHLKTPVKVLLTGGAAGVLGGVVRATFDIDFEITLKSNVSSTDWDHVQKAIQETARTTGITPEYADDIDRWSAISLPAKSSRLYQRFGKVELRVLDPGLWAIGKLTRYYHPDIQDLRKVLKTAKSDAKSLARLWGKALGMSPPSGSQGLFRKQVEAFFDHYTHEIWGDNEDPAILKRLFLEAAQKIKNRPIK